MSESIQGRSPSPRDEYVIEFKKSLDLFENALKEYQQTSADNPEKRAAFKKVMDQTLKVMSETAKTTCRKEAQEKSERQLEQDYKQFEKDFQSGNKDAQDKDYEKLLEDVGHLKDAFK